MLRLLKGIIFLFIGFISIQALANETTKTYPAAQEVVIPGYTPPTPSSPTATLSTTGSTQMTSSSSAATQPPGPPPSPQAMHKSCEVYIPIKASIDVAADNFKNKYNETSKADIYRWSRDQEPDIVITFLDNNTPIAVKGTLPLTLVGAKDLHFSLSDVQQALSAPGVIIGHYHVFSQKYFSGKLIINTDSKDMITSFTTEFPCILK